MKTLQISCISLERRVWNRSSQSHSQEY